jgi:predicted AAA+ superfamily ATPase
MLTAAGSPSSPGSSTDSRDSLRLCSAARAAYFRTQTGDEVDLVLETWDGRVAGFEVKAGSRVQDSDLSGLRLLRDRLGERFMAGFLLNLGELAYRKEERIIIMPLSGLWSLASSQSSAKTGACPGSAR